MTRVSDFTCKNGGGAFPGERGHLVNSLELPPNATLALSCVFGCWLRLLVAFQMMQTLPLVGGIFVIQFRKKFPQMGSLELFMQCLSLRLLPITTN